MQIIGLGKATSFMQKHADCRFWIRNWIAETRKAKWVCPQDIKDKYSSASFLKENVIIFNVKGNLYRLEVFVAYKTGKVLIKWLGTHAEYSRKHS
jgi:mRNA interferase HigB